MNYEMGGTILCKTVNEKDLGVTINANMKVSEQCRIAACKGNLTTGKSFAETQAMAHNRQEWRELTRKSTMTRPYGSSRS